MNKIFSISKAFYLNAKNFDGKKSPKFVDELSYVENTLLTALYVAYCKNGVNR